MAEIILSEKQLYTIRQTLSFERKLELAEQNWKNFSENEKQAIVECLKTFYPEKNKLIKEATGWNTLGDIMGIFDPTGVVDIINGISYIYQGDNLFGLLSLISAVPYVGDVVAKPVMAVSKVGAPTAKNLEKVLKLSRAGNSVEAANLLTKLTEQGGLTAKFVKGFGKVAGKLRGYIERAPIGIFRGLKKTILQWFDLFEAAAKRGSKVRIKGGLLAKSLPQLTKAEQIAKLKEFKKLASQTNIFRSYRTSKGILSWKTLFRGMPQLIGRNASIRALARQTKWWLGFLDFIGLGNYVGPDELSKKIGEAKMMEKMEEYQKTPEATKNFSDDFGQESQDTTTQQKTSTSSSDSEDASVSNPLKKFFNKLFMGAVNPLPI